MSSGYSSTESPQIIPKLYKYIKKQWADDLLVYGKLRISTLHTYYFTDSTQSQEQGDHSEGVFDGIVVNVVTDSAGRMLSPNTGRDLGSYAKQLVSPFFSVGSTGEIRECRISGYLTNPFVFCLSEKLCHSLASRFQCDACVEIVDPRGFSNIIERRLHQLEKIPKINGKIDRCVYIHKRNISAGDDPWPDPYFAKPVSYSHQKEWRFVWHSNAHPFTVEHVALELPALRPLLKRVF